MKEMSLKKIITCSIAAATALFTLIALAYPLAQTTFFGTRITESGFTLLDFRSRVMDQSDCNLIGVFAWLQLLASIGFLTANIVALFRFEKKTAKKWALATVITCMILNFIYFILGVSLVSDANAYTTVSYVALIIGVLFTVGYFVCVKVIKEDATLKRKEKNVKAQRDDSADLLAKYKKLLDEGAITQEEYDKKKKELL